MLVDLTLNGKPLTMDLDTGVSVFLRFRADLPTAKAEVSLRSATVTLRMYSGELVEVKAKGCANVAVKYAGQQATLPLYVVQQRRRKGVLEVHEHHQN